MGNGKIEDIIPIAEQFDLSGVAAGSALHYENLVAKIKKQLLDIGCKIRK